MGVWVCEGVRGCGCVGVNVRVFRCLGVCVWMSGDKVACELVLCVP